VIFLFNKYCRTRITNKESSLDTRASTLKKNVIVIINTDETIKPKRPIIKKEVSLA